MNCKDQDIKDLLLKIHNWYDTNHPQLVSYANNATGGQKRKASGDFIENFLQSIFDEINEKFQINIVSKVGSKDLLKKNINYCGKIYTLDHIQVDRHISFNGKRIAFIENKTYLDSCYWDRALADFRKIISALYQNNIFPEEMDYIVFSGQDSLDNDTRLAYEGDFFNDTKQFTKNGKGIIPHIFCFLEHKRSSNKPMYKIKYNIKDQVIENFIKLILKHI